MSNDFPEWRALLIWYISVDKKISEADHVNIYIYTYANYTTQHIITLEINYSCFTYSFFLL